MLKNVIRDALREGHEALIRCISEGLTGVERRGSFGDYSRKFDLITERAIIAGLKRTIERIYIISEEVGKIECNNPEIYALIDPVDGSNNVANGLSFSASAILLAKGPYLSDAIAAGVIDHSSGRIYLGDKNDVSVDDRSPSIRKKVRLSDALVFLDLGSLRKDVEDSYNPTELSIRLIRSAKHTRFFAAASLEIAHILEGRADAYACFTKDLKIMDFAASICLLKWAGGVYKILGDENPLLLDTRRYGVIAASSEELLGEILALWD
jgi:fructose-1,6-bisphosphatase/inositol monophosphatase family enzyme